MWGDINRILGFRNTSADSLGGHFCLFIDDDKSDADFLISSLLHFYLKRGVSSAEEPKVIFLHVAHSFAHYHTISSKCGISLRSSCDSGHLTCIDGLGLLRDLIISDADSSNIDTSDNPFRFVLRTDPEASARHSLKPLYDKISKEVRDKAAGKDFLILIDDVTSFLGLGASVAEVCDFVHYCFALCRAHGYGDGDSMKGVLALLAHQGGEDADQLLRVLKVSSTIHIETRGLPTGHSKDIHGEVTFTKRNFESGCPYITKMHYKVGDRGAKFFAKGTAAGLM